MMVMTRSAVSVELQYSTGLRVEGGDTQIPSRRVIGIVPSLFLVPKRTTFCTKMLLVPSALKATLERVVSPADVRTCVLLTSKSRLLSYASHPQYAEDLVKVLVSLAAGAWREAQRDKTFHEEGGLAKEDQIVMMESELGRVVVMPIYAPSSSDVSPTPSFISSDKVSGAQVIRTSHDHARETNTNGSPNDDSQSSSQSNQTIF